MERVWPGTDWIWAQEQPSDINHFESESSVYGMHLNGSFSFLWHPVSSAPMQGKFYLRSLLLYKILDWNIYIRTEMVKLTGLRSIFHFHFPLQFNRQSHLDAYLSFIYFNFLISDFFLCHYYPFLNPNAILLFLYHFSDFFFMLWKASLYFSFHSVGILFDGKKKKGKIKNSFHKFITFSKEECYRIFLYDTKKWILSHALSYYKVGK